MKKVKLKYPAFVVVLIVLWAAASWYAWSDAGSRRLKSYPAVGIAAVSILFLSWPAHEVCLGISGAGFGANARSAATLGTFVIFLVQAILTWSLLLAMVIVRKYFLPLLFAQAGLLLLIFITFWRFGNG